ncbi:hypothetical protein NUU61_003455 [Penicillium alfredii]|uniref:Carboxylic ester hydrolase n=1 Tax=Penicillium alfredii TaxID=1506179 RepID=A0A9W9KCX0_9EURO|nr:uncharacterized protein NUU61_003455 [Penicillium alfredii]KAJ5101233.1 hypothetical protein NUU61_003455 [Penicillium alfredii]
MAVFLIAGLLGGLLSKSPSSLPRAPTIDLGYSRYQGVSLHNGVDQYLSMRYAKAPTDDLRFRAPRDPDHTENLLDASSLVWARLCRGRAVGDRVASGRLFIRQCLATKERQLKLQSPGLVLYSRGGYAVDSNANYNGSEVVEQSGHEIVFVNFNYRVGALGFLASESVRKNGDLNAGLLDQRKALHWVQKYIRQFGGNPNHVVIHGDSAGAGSVAHHLTAYGGQNTTLFVGAVAESSFWPTLRTVAEMEFQYERFARDVGCHSADDVLACLRATDIKTIQMANVARPFPGGSSAPIPLWYFLPVVDGTLIPGRLYSLFDQGQFIAVPLMVSDDTNEGTSFAYDATNQLEVAQFMKNNYPGLSGLQLNAIHKAYPRMNALPQHGAYFPSAAAAYGDSTFTCPGNLMATNMARHFSSSQVWNYRFNVRDPTEVANGMGVPHVFDLPAIFGVGQTNMPAYSYANSNADIVPITMDYYLSFIKALNPNTHRNSIAPEWHAWGSGAGQRLKLQTNATAMEKVPQTQLEHCSMWKTFAADMEH